MTFGTSVACVICLLYSSRCAWFKFGNWSIACWTFCFAVAKFVLPFKSFLACVTLFNAAVISLGVTTTSGVPLINASAFATAWLYAFCLSESALTKLPSAFVCSLSAMPCFNCVIALFNSCAVCLTLFTPATVVAFCTCCFNASFCAWLRSLELLINAVASSFACWTLALPFNACFAALTCWIACSTSVCVALPPLAFEMIFSAFVTAVLYACCFAWSASVKLTVAFVASLSAIACFKLPIAVFKFCAFCLIWFASSTVCAPLIWLVTACFCALFKLSNEPKDCVACCFAASKFSLPFKAFLDVLTCPAAWLITVGSNEGFVVWSIIPCAVVTALLYASFLFGLASV